MHGVRLKRAWSAIKDLLHCKCTHAQYIHRYTFMYLMICKWCCKHKLWNNIIQDPFQHHATGYPPETSCMCQNLPWLTECIGYFRCTLYVNGIVNTKVCTQQPFQHDATGNPSQNSCITMDLYKNLPLYRMC